MAQQPDIYVVSYRGDNIYVGPSWQHAKERMNDPGEYYIEEWEARTYDPDSEYIMSMSYTMRVGHECEGFCEKHRGEVKKCRIMGAHANEVFTFYYCEEAREYDEKNGWEIKIIES